MPSRATRTRKAANRAATRKRPTRSHDRRAAAPAAGDGVERRSAASGRPIWRGAISFGLVNIPIELHTAIHYHRPRFRLLHAQDKSPVKYERVCQREGKPVAWEDLVKGYEYAKGEFV